MPHPIPVSVALQSLEGVSHLAAQAWERLNEAETLDAEAEELEWLWQMQDTQEDLVDAHAELADQIEAEVAAVTARLQHLTQVHTKELERLRRWREMLDRTILKLNEQGVIGTEMAGHSRRIRIKLNPPACEVVALSQVPDEYITIKVVEERKPDKTAIKAAWNQGNPVPGTNVTRSRKVVYELVPSSLDRFKAK